MKTTPPAPSPDGPGLGCAILVFLPFAAAAAWLVVKAVSFLQ